MAKKSSVAPCGTRSAAAPRETPAREKLARLISILEKNGRRHPVLGLLRQIITSFNEQNPQAALSKSVRQSTATHSGSDDDEIVFAMFKVSGGQ
jgi:hypothetical protein